MKFAPGNFREMKTFLIVLIATAGLSSLRAPAQNPPTEEVSIGFLPAEWITSALRKTLSPQGRFSLVTPTGPVRITDAGERIDAARRALQYLQNAPALVPIEIVFTTYAQREVSRMHVEPPVLNYGIPVPDRYDPPRILAGAGGVVVVPAQPHNFTTRGVGSGAVVTPSAGGYSPGDPEMRVGGTDVTNGITRRLSVSTVLGRPVIATVVRQSPAVPALRALAERYRAIAGNEPAWSAAGTELQMTPEPAGGAVMVRVIPQIVLPPAAAGQPPRRLPLQACTAGVMIARGAQSQTGVLPGTDPEFYRTFLSAPQLGADSFTSLTVSADVQYIGGPPK